MKALIVGYGSIGTRHTRILKDLECDVAVVTSRSSVYETCFESIAEAVHKFGPDYAVISTETARHMEGIEELKEVGFNGTLLVEKPLFHVPLHMLPAVTHNCYVAYNLRFHPMFQRLRDILISQKILSVQAYVGQYLPLWRPDRDYRHVYSAKQNAGGGVLRDLSHELDLLNWLLGGWQKLTALGGHYSKLEIDSDDVFSVLIKTTLCPVVTVQMNYLDRIGQRHITVNTDELTIEADLVAGHLLINNTCEEFKVERDHTYREMHRALLAGQIQDVCTFAEGFNVVNMIAATEQSVLGGKWIAK